MIFCAKFGFFLVWYFVVNRTSSVNSLKLFWLSNNAGLFSQFLQLRLVFHYASKHGRSLVVVPTTSPHYHDQKIVMCDIFTLPQNVSCGALPNAMVCNKNFKIILNSSELKDACYSGTVAFNSRERVRSWIIKSVDFPLQFRFSSMYDDFALKFFYALEGAVCSNRTQCTDFHTFTVVHWRRGDQLLGRCPKHVDNSVNCANATALVHKVREHSTDLVVYVATNEPQTSLEMIELRRQGFVTYRDVARGNPELMDASSFMALVAETHLMLTAATFLGWGVSEINDVVEHERRASGRSHCIDQPAPREESQYNWCTTHHINNNAARIV